MSERISGQCLCGAVAFDLPSVSHVDACHCGMCRRWTGGVFIGVDVQEHDLRFTCQDGLAWYDSSEWAMRGFCRACGSSLFYRFKPLPERWSVLAGALDLPAGVPLTKEIFIDSKPDYYALAGDRPRLTAVETLAEFQASLQSDPP